MSMEQEKTQNQDKKPSFFINPERIQDMTDGVFAFAMTLLIVGIEFPTPEGKITDSQLSQSLIDMIPTFSKFILSFFLIAVFWITHHKQFKSIKKSNDGLIWINVLLLLCIVFIPFTTDVMDDYNYLKVGLLIFNANILLVGLLYYVQWSYAIKHKLVDERLAESHKKYGLAKNSVTWIVALLALIVGLFDTTFSPYIYFLIPIITIIIHKSEKYRE